MNFNFDDCPCRKNTGSRKWDKYHNSETIPAWIADMDFPSCQEIIDAIKERAEHGVFGYTDPKPSLRTAVVDHVREMQGWEIKPEWLVFTPTLISAISTSVRAFCPPTGTAICLQPVYPPLIFTPKHWGRNTLTAPVIYENNRWKLNIDAIEENAKNNPSAKFLILCSPYNPYGLILREHELERIAEIAERYDLTICSDEIHCDLILDTNLHHRSLASLNEKIAQRTITLMAASKTYNIAGLACGFAIIPNEKMRERFCEEIEGSGADVNLFGLHATEVAFRKGEPWRQACLQYLRANLDFLCEEIAKIPGVKMPMRPEASFLAWIDVSALNLDDPAGTFAKGGVGMNPGTDFAASKDFLRLNFACPRKCLVEIIKNIKAVAEAHISK